MNSRSLRFNRIGGFFLALNLLAGNLGYFRRGLDLFAGLVLTLLLAGTYLAESRARKPDGPKKLFVRGLIFFLALIFLLRAGSLRIYVLPFLVFSLLAGFAEDERPIRELSVVLAALTLYLGFDFLYRNLPEFFRPIAGFSFFLSRGLSRSRVELGPSVLGIPLLASAICFQAACWLRSGKRGVRDPAVQFLLLFVNAAFSLTFFLWLYVNAVGPAAADVATAFSYLYPNSLHFLLLILLLPGMYLHCRWTGESVSGMEIHARGRRGRLPAAAAVFLFGCALLSRVPGRAGGRNVHIFDRNYLVWTMPDFERLGGEQGASYFGRLPGFLRARGYPVTIGELSPETLAQTDVLVLINLPGKFTPEEKKQVWDFVGNGGGLLVLGDHTGGEAVREPFNDLLAPAGIGFNFDSAKPFVEGWQEALHLFPHPVTRGLETAAADAQIWIGASLASRPPSWPVIVGTYGFSDRGDPENKNGGLGDLKYAPGERLGDLVLVAESRRGKGKILVFGDTSSFQNLALTASHRFVENVFSWLSEKREKTFAAFPLFAAAAIVLFFFRRRRPDVLLLVLGAGALALAEASAGHLPGGGLVREERPKEKIARVDLSHCEKLSLKVWGPDAAGGLFLNLIRNGYSPLLLREFDRRKIAEADGLILVAPQRAFSRAETDFLERFVRDGGRLIVCAGGEERRPARALLQRFGFAVGNVPLGKLPPEKNSAGIYQACAWNLETGAGEKEILCRAWDYPVIAAKTPGKGRVIAIADAEFLLNKNLEDRDEYRKENVEFLRRLLGPEGGGR